MEDEAEETEGAAGADDDVSVLLLCVMNRRRSFMAGLKVMMIFSTWRQKVSVSPRWSRMPRLCFSNLTCSFTLSPVYMYLM